VCVVEKWREDPFYGAVAVVKAEGYVVGDFTGWIHGAFRDYVELPPGVYTVGGEECAIEPLSYPWHFSVPYMAARWGDVVELRIYATEEPEVPGGFVAKLADVGPFSVYLAAARGASYVVKCCGRSRRFKVPPPGDAPRLSALYEVLPDRAGPRRGCRDLSRQFCGGTLKDVAALAAGAVDFADGLYLHPIYPAMSYHRYDVVNHFDVDERVGGWAAFYALKEALAKVGMGLVLDLVLYHVAPRSPLFPDGPFVIKSAEGARLVKKLVEILPREALRGVFFGEPPYETFLKVWLMPRLDYTRREAVEYARRVVEFWAPHVDGFRLDVAHGVPPEAWRAALEPARGRYVFGEHVGNPASFYHAVRGFTAYLLYHHGVKRLGDGVEEVVRGVNRYLALTPPSAAPYMNLFLENHDLDRAASFLSPDAVAMGYALIYSLPGVPSVYMGGECGEVGRAEDHTNRRPFPGCGGHPLKSFLAKLFAARKRLGLSVGPTYAYTRRGRLVLWRGDVEVEVERGRAVFTSPGGSSEIFI